MKSTILLRRGALLMALAVPFAMTGCKNKEQTAEIKRLNESVEQLEYDLNDFRQLNTDLKKRIGDLQQKVAAEQKKSYQLQRDLNTATRELERYREMERRAAEEKKQEPSRAEKLAQAKKLAQEQLSATVTVTGDKTTGTGLLVEADGKTWLYVPASVLSGNSKLEITTEDGETLKKFGAFEVATGADLARLEVTEPPEKKITLPKEPVDFSSGTLGLLAVDDSAQLISGRAYGSKPDSLETDYGISHCPAGSPVFQEETGTLVGIVTEPLSAQRDLWRQDDDRNAPRRIVTRLDRKLKWTAMPIGSFLKEGKMLERADEFTRLIHAFVAVEPNATSINLSAGVAGGVSADEIFEKNKDSSVVRSLRDLKEWIEKNQGKKISPRDVQRRVLSVMDQMDSVARRETKAFEALKFSPYHRAAAKQSLQWRKEAMQQLKDMIQRAREPVE